MQSAANEPHAWHLRHVIATDTSVNEKDIEAVCDWLLPVMQQVWADYTDSDGDLRIPHDCYLKIWAMGQPILHTDFI